MLWITWDACCKCRFSGILPNFLKANLFGKAWESFHKHPKIIIIRQVWKTLLYGDLLTLTHLKVNQSGKSLLWGILCNPSPWTLLDVVNFYNNFRGKYYCKQINWGQGASPSVLEYIPKLLQKVMVARQPHWYLSSSEGIIFTTYWATIQRISSLRGLCGVRWKKIKVEP